MAKTDKSNVRPDGHLTMAYRPSKEGGFVGIIMEIPGAASQGENLEELEANLKNAVAAIHWFNKSNKRREIGEDSFTEKLILA